MIDAKAITVRRSGQTVLDAVSLTLGTGEVVGVVGPNGSGKTTLLRSLFGACRIDGGEICLDDQPIARLSRRAIARKIAVVPQVQALEAEQTVYDMVSLGRLPHLTWLDSTGARDDAAIVAALERVGLAQFAARPLRALSGGELQRAMIARALCQEAGHLLLDEPTNHIDLGYQHELLQFIRGLGLATLVVLHDLNLAARYCDRLLLLDRGRLAVSGPPACVLAPERVAAIYGVATSGITTPSGRPHLLFADAPDSPTQETRHATT